MPSFSRHFEESLHRAVAYANARKHEFATLEHLLLALTHDQDAEEVLKACSADIKQLRKHVTKYLDEELTSLITAEKEDAKPTAGFQRVIQRSVIHVQSSGREEVNGANALVALFSERESHAAYFLQEQNITRYDAVSFIVNGKPSIISTPTPPVKDETPKSGENPSFEMFVSYAWGDDTPEGRLREETVEKLCASAEARGLRIIRDKDKLKIGDSISEFMRRIGSGDRIFVILSDKYLRSPNCMLELSEIWRTSKQEGSEFMRRVKILTLPDAKIRNPVDWVRWAIFWKESHAELEALAHEHGIGILGEHGHRRLLQMHTFYTQVADILGTLSDFILPKTFEDLEKHGFSDLAK